MQFCPLSSGSSGNSMFLRGGGTSLLIDAGLPARVITRSLASLDVAIKDIEGILITHEHNDHVRGAAVLARKYDIPIYANEGTAEQLSFMLPQNTVIRCLSSEGTRFGDLLVKYFPVPHDAVAPIGFVFEADGVRAALATDLGHMTPQVVQAITGAQLIILESNHDEVMLATSRYPEHLKARIRSSHGHLSNTQAAQALKAAVHDDLRHIVLAHLSRENNDPGLARETVEAALSSNGHIPIHVTGHFQVGPFLEI